MIKGVFYGRMELQPFFEKMLTIALGGMNLGNVDLRCNGERWMLQTVLRHHPNAVIFDVGANVGEYATAALNASDTRPSVHCFEPSPAAFQQLREQLGNAPGVQLYPFGLSSTDGAVAMLHCNTAGGTGSSLVSKELPDGLYDYPLREQVRLRTLDAFIAESGISKVDLLKIDVEGLELEVLKGSSQTIAQGRIDRIQFEFGEGSVTAGVTFRDFYVLLSPEYELYRLVRKGLRRIPRYSVVLEQYVTGNYVAIRKGVGR